MQVADSFDGPSGVDNVILNLPNHISEAMMTMMENIDSINSKVSHVTLTVSDSGAFCSNMQAGCEFDFQISWWLGSFQFDVIPSPFCLIGVLPGTRPSCCSSEAHILSCWATANCVSVDSCSSHCVALQ